MNTTIRQTSVFGRARAYVYKIPSAIEGSHGDCQTLAVANVLVWDFALSISEALPILHDYNARCSPPWSEAELIHKLQSAEKQPHTKPRGNLLGDKPSPLRVPEWKRPSSSSPKSQIDPASVVENFLRGFRCEEADLWVASPIRPPEDWTKDALALLALLFGPGEQINFVTAFTVDKNGKAAPKDKGETVERDALLARWRNEGMPRSEAGGWLRMNPLDGRGVADTNVTALRFALIECDDVPLELQLSLLAKLPLPIAAILTSGGRSLHAWVKVDAAAVEDYRCIVTRMLALLATFGVDSKNKNPARLSRLPGVVRRIGAASDGRQRLLYLNPQPEQTAIL
ncbi:MAG: hypothetical protein ABI651_19810 [Verrucomicrobiota bacterium]